MEIEIAEATPADRDDVATLYAEAGYGAPIDESDTVIAATSDGQLVGAVRLCSEHGVTALRGMQIRSSFQRRGIGAMLLTACQPYLDQRTAYCLPYSHLVGFYAAAGFEVIGAAELPAFLARRLASYLANGQDVLAMRHTVKKGRDEPSL